MKTAALKYGVAHCLLFGTLWAGCRGAAPSDAEVRDVLRRQLTCWNAGDIDGFMEGYWKSDELTFSAGGQTARGWEATRRRYRQRYPDRQQMGRLSFSDLEVTALDADAALVLGRWHLARPEEPVGGNFSLVMRRFADGWRIVHDHTSREAATPLETRPAGAAPE